MKKIIEAGVQILGVSAVRYFVLAGTPFILFYWLFPGNVLRSKIQQKLASRADYLREIFYSMQSTFVFTLIAVVLLLTPLKHYTRIYDNLGDFPQWYLWLSVAICLILHDTYFYWTHRLLHHKKLFRFTHLVHHKSTNPSPWTSYSFHLTEAFVEGGVLLVIVMCIPVHTLTIVIFTITSFIINVYGHLGYEIAPKWFRRTWAFELLNTSVHHNLHHSKFNGNYGLYFRFWDRIMHTENPDYVKEYDRIQAQRFGSFPQTVTAASVSHS